MAARDHSFRVFDVVVENISSVILTLRIGETEAPEEETRSRATGAGVRCKP